MILTKSEIAAEWLYRYTENIGIVCGDKEPTDEQKAYCRREADKTIAMLKSGDQVSLFAE